MNKNQRDDLTGLTNRHVDFLILNSLSFFEKSLLLMEKHENYSPLLDHDNAGRKCTRLALKRSLQFKDGSKIYQGFKISMTR